MTDSTVPSDRAGHDRARVELTRQVFSFADQEYQRGARDALLKVLRALDAGLAPEVAGVLRRLTYQPGHVADVPAILAGLVDAAAYLDARKGGEGS